jgi:hypothetical protein
VNEFEGQEAKLPSDEEGGREAPGCSHQWIDSSHN